MSKHSLDDENKKKYGAKAREWNKIVSENTPLYFDENVDYTVKVNEFSDKVNKGLSEALKDVAKKGSKDRYEHMYLVDLDTGEKLYYETNGEPSSVGVDFWKFAEKHTNKKMAFVHNHNIVSSLSETDLMTPITSNNISVVFAVQNDGVIYYAKKTKNVPKGFWADEYFEENLRTLNVATRNGTISAAERSLKREEIVIRGLLQEFYEGMVVVNGKRK